MYGIFRVFEQLPRLFDRNFAGLIEREMVFAAVKQRHTERILHMPHGARQRWLRDMQLFRRLGKRTAFGKRHELRQLQQIEHSSLSFAMQIVYTGFQNFYFTFSLYRSMLGL